MSQIDPVELLAYPFGRLGAQDLALSALVRFDLINHQFNFPALMIQGDQFERWSHPRIEQGRHQAIHLAHLSQTLIGHPIGDDAHPHATAYGVVRRAWTRWANPGEHRAIGQSARLSQVFPHPGFQGPQQMSPLRSHMLDEPSRGDAYLPYD